MFRKLIQSIRANISEYRKNNSLPGAWKLYEYYTERGSELFNLKEEQIVSENLYWNISFNEDGKFLSSTNLQIPVVTELESGTWSKSRNFFNVHYSDNSGKSVEFQYAFEKGNLKILKKDKPGKILVFAFFKRLTE